MAHRTSLLMSGCAVLAACGLVAGQDQLQVRFADDSPIVLLVEDFADGPVLVETVVEAGWFGEPGDGALGPYHIVGNLEAPAALLLPLPTRLGEQPWAMGGAFEPFGHTFEPVSPERLSADRRFEWARLPVEDPSGENPPGPYGVDEFVPIGSFFAEIDVAPPVTYELIADVTARSIREWVFQNGYWLPTIDTRTEPILERRVLLVGADTCHAALPISAGIHELNNVRATTGTIGQTAACAPSPPGIDHDLWYVYTAQESRTVVFSTCDSSIDTEIALYRTTDCDAVGAASLIACSDDEGACADNGGMVAAALDAGESILVQIGSAPGAAPGEFMLEITGRPDNDRCDMAIPIDLDQVHFDTTFASSGDAGAPMGCSENDPDGIARDVWFEFSAPEDAEYVFTTCFSRGTPRLALYATADCAQANAETLIACAEDPCHEDVGAPQVTWPMFAGERVLLQIGTAPDMPGHSSLRLTIGQAPENNHCENALEVGLGQHSAAGRRFATDSAHRDVAASCFDDGMGIPNDVWFRFVVPETEQYFIRTGRAAMYGVEDCTDVSLKSLIRCEGGIVDLYEGQTMLVQSGSGTLLLSLVGEYRLRFMNERVRVTRRTSKTVPR